MDTFLFGQRGHHAVLHVELELEHALVFVTILRQVFRRQTEEMALLVLANRCIWKIVSCKDVKVRLIQQILTLLTHDP